MYYWNRKEKITRSINFAARDGKRTILLPILFNICKPFSISLSVGLGALTINKFPHAPSSDSVALFISFNSPWCVRRELTSKNTLKMDETYSVMKCVQNRARHRRSRPWRVQGHPFQSGAQVLLPDQYYETKSDVVVCLYLIMQWTPPRLNGRGPSPPIVHPNQIVHCYSEACSVGTTLGSRAWCCSVVFKGSEKHCSKTPIDGYIFLVNNWKTKIFFDPRTGTEINELI